MLPALSGPRSPYADELGLVQAGAPADLLSVDGDPLEN
jgi:imidazolonepropionase-like amidohydrolase